MSVWPLGNVTIHDKPLFVANGAPLKGPTPLHMLLIQSPSQMNQFIIFITTILINIHHFIAHSLRATNSVTCCTNPSQHRLLPRLI